MLFADRRDAGRRLAERLRAYKGGPDVLVLGLPRGGVPVAYEVAAGLGASLDVFLVRKLGVPGREELAMGAIASGDVRVLNDDVVQRLGLRDAEIEEVAAREQRELERRELAYRQDRPPAVVEGRTVILVDDGLATGSTMRAAARALRRRNPRRLVLAVPVGAPETCESLRSEADAVICGVAPEEFYAVGLWYEDFGQTTDDEVRALLAASRAPSRAAPSESTTRG